MCCEKGQQLETGYCKVSSVDQRSYWLSLCWKMCQSLLGHHNQEGVRAEIGIKVAGHDDWWMTGLSSTQRELRVNKRGMSLLGAEGACTRPWKHLLLQSLALLHCCTVQHF